MMLLFTPGQLGTVWIHKFSQRARRGLLWRADFRTTLLSINQVRNRLPKKKKGKITDCGAVPFVMSVAGLVRVQPFFNNMDLKSHLKNNDLFLVKESLASLSLSRHIVIHHNSLLAPGEMLLTLLPTSL